MDRHDSKVPGCKVVLLGDSGVGKTCIIKRFVSNSFESNMITTNACKLLF